MWSNSFFCSAWNALWYIQFGITLHKTGANHIQISLWLKQNIVLFSLIFNSVCKTYLSKPVNFNLTHKWNDLYKHSSSIVRVQCCLKSLWEQVHSVNPTFIKKYPIDLVAHILAKFCCHKPNILFMYMVNILNCSQLCYIMLHHEHHHGVRI